MVALSVPLPPALVGLWRFDEGTGDQVWDSSGLTNHGVLASDPADDSLKPARVASEPGFGQALRFQNDGFTHSYVDVLPNDSLQFGMTSNATWTITAWAYEASDGAGNTVSRWGRLFAQNGGFGINFNSGSSSDSDLQYYIWHHGLGAWQIGRA